MDTITYNRKAAAQYALRWAYLYNPEWPNHTGNSHHHGDCTNFVSQCLHAGGWRMDGSTSWLGKQGWYVDGNGASHAWAGAQPFANYLKSSGRARRCTRAELDVGDVISLLVKGSVFHNVIVSRVDWTKERLKRSLTSLFQDSGINGIAACRADIGLVPTNKVMFISAHDINRSNYELTDWENAQVTKQKGTSLLYWKISDTSAPPAARSCSLWPSL